MLITVDGVVIGRRTIGEANCYLDILTAEYGVIEVLGHSVKKMNSKNAASTALFSYATFCFNKNKERYTINSSSPKYSFHKLSRDIVSLSLAAYFAEIVKYCSASEQLDEKIMRLFLITLYELEKNLLPHEQLKAIFELRIASLLGFMPDLRACSDCICYTASEMYFLLQKGIIYCGDCFDDSRQRDGMVFLLDESLLYMLRWIIYSSVEKIYKFKTTDKYIRELSVITESYLMSHIDKRFKTLSYYKEIIVK